MNTIVANAEVNNPSAPSRIEAFRIWLRIGLLSFGGPAAQIALMHREVVDRKSWLSEQQYINALSFCMLLPGPEAMQLATYVGWRLHGTLGGLVAGILFVLPGAIVVLALSAVYALFGELPLITTLFLGIKAAVIIIVIEALLKVSKRALHLPAHWVIAGLAFVAIFFLALPFPLIILVAAAYGILQKPELIKDGGVSVTNISLGNSLLTATIWLCLWWLPILLLFFLGNEMLLLEIGVFFSKLAVVTFGGAYAVLAYLGQDVVGQFGWLTATEMMDGLGLAETTPGPLILVNEFVGFIAGYRHDGLLTGFFAALITLWVTFVPCFLWIFVGAPYIDWIGNQPRLRAALTAITAAVVGVILNLAIWFSLHVFFGKVEASNVGPLIFWQPDLNTLDWRVVLLSLISALLLLKLHWGIFRVLLVSSLGGYVLTLFLGS